MPLLQKHLITADKWWRENSEARRDADYPLSYYNEKVRQLLTSKKIYIERYICAWNGLQLTPFIRDFEAKSRDLKYIIGKNQNGHTEEEMRE